MSAVEFRMLGPLEVCNESGTVALGGTKPRAVMAVLLLHANESVRADRLALALWGDDAPASAVKTVQAYVYRLRRALGDADVLTTTPVGYRLLVRPGELDAEQFELLVEDGRRALAAGQFDHAARVLRDALALWRGLALEDLAYEPFAQVEIARLEEQRLAALEARVEADLGSGRHAEMLGELRGLTAANPQRERLAGQLMLALYRCGRQVEALDVYREIRERLVAEIGVEPGPELRRLQEAILRQDDALESPAAPAELPPALDVSDESPLVGRDDDLIWLRRWWQRAREGAGGVVTLAGASGSGKLRLAAELAGIVHDGGDVVLYASGAGPGEAFRAACAHTAQTTRPALLVIHAADSAGSEALAELKSLSRALADLPVLVLACATDADVLAGLHGDEVLVLKALDAEAVGAIARQYARGADTQVPARWLLEESGGLPGAVHEVSSRWAQREAVRRVGDVAGRAASGRQELRSIQAELIGDVEDLQEVRKRITPRRRDAPVVCPFKGLASFDVDDAPYFFGREGLVAKLVTRLVGAHLLGIVGPSGSGKSSVMRAGLLPALATGVLPGSEQWRRVLIRPGEHPLRELTDAMQAVAVDERCVIAVDQFEETFTTCDDESEREAFIAELCDLAADDREGGHLVVIALRADFYGRCAAYPRLAGPLEANHVLVSSMQRFELRRAIELPAHGVGLRVDRELVDALVLDVDDEPAALTLLSTALLELWQRRDGRRLRHTAYEQSGGVRGAVARLAEGAFGQLDEQEQELARGVLMRLASEGPGGGVERRRVPLSELETDRSDELARVVALLTDRRLLTVSAGAIELAHEALLREWPRLSDWIAADREGLRIRRMLNAAAREWLQLGRDGDALYRGTRLTEALEWREAQEPALNELEREFLAASEAGRAHDLATGRRRTRLTGIAFATVAAATVAIIVAVAFADRARDVAASRDLATKSSTLLATDPGLAVAIAFEARRRSDTDEAQRAIRQAALAHRAARVIAAHDKLTFGVSPSDDGRLAASAGGDGRVRVWDVASGRRVGEIRVGDEVRAVAFTHDGKQVAISVHDGRIAVAPATGGAARVLTRLPEGGHATTIDVRPDDKAIIAGTATGRVIVVGLRDGDVRDLKPHPETPVFGVDYDRDGGRMLSAGYDGVTRVWSAAGGPSIALVQRAGFLAASFSPDGEHVATGDANGVVKQWNARSGKTEMQMKVSNELLLSVRYSADGRRIVTGGLDGAVRVVLVPRRAVLAELRGHDGPSRGEFVPGSGAVLSSGDEDGTVRISTLPATRIPPRTGTLPRFGRDGAVVSGSADDGTIGLWNPKTGGSRRFLGHGAQAFPQLSPDGKQIVSASDDFTVRLWNVESRRSQVVPTLEGEKYAAAISAGGRIAIGGVTPLVIQDADGSDRTKLRPSNGYVNALVFSPNSKHLLTGGDDGIARVWDTRTGRLARPLRGHEGIIRGVAYSPSGDSIATAGSDGTVRVWPAGGGAAVILVGHEGGVNTARFNTAGDRLVTAGDDGRILIWDAAGGAPLVELYRHDGAVTGADFSPDGRSVVSAAADGMRVTACEVCGTFEETLGVARMRAQHTLSDAERQRLLSGE